MRHHVLPSAFQRTAALALVLRVVSGCASAPPPVAAEEDLLDAFCSRPERVLGTTRASVVRALGEPRDETAAVVPNRHEPGVEDRIVTLRWAGIEIVLHEVPKYDRSFLSSVRVSRTGTGIFGAAGPGTAADELLERLASLGRLDIESAELARFECPGELPPVIELRFDDRRVTEILYIHEPD